jgi:hypothetical protein
MARGRDVRNPIARTYLTKTRSPSGEIRVHSRLYSPEYSVDKRGTGSTITEAMNKILTGLRAPTKRRHQ